MRESDEQDDTNDTGRQEETDALEDGSKFDIRGQSLDHIDIDPYGRRDRTHGRHHGQDNRKPYGIEAESHSQGKKDRDRQDQEPQGINKTPPDQVNQQNESQNFPLLLLQHNVLPNHHLLS